MAQAKKRIYKRDARPAHASLCSLLRQPAGKLDVHKRPEASPLFAESAPPSGRCFFSSLRIRQPRMPGVRGRRAGFRGSQGASLCEKQRYAEIKCHGGEEVEAQRSCSRAQAVEIFRSANRAPHRFNLATLAVLGIVRAFVSLFALSCRPQPLNTEVPGRS